MACRRRSLSDSEDLAVAACLRFRTLQTLLRWGAAVPVVVLAFFVFASPASGLIIAPDTVLQETSGVGNPIPVVVLVLDELPVQTLMNAEGNIDSSRYPGFASLLDDFTWYRNTATMHHHTAKVLPMILTGGPARDDLEPSSLGYPNNLFTMLANSHDVWAHEELTDFCGPEICREQPHPECARTMAAPAHRHERRRRPCCPPDGGGDVATTTRRCLDGLRSGRADSRYDRPDSH